MQAAESGVAARHSAASGQNILSLNSDDAYLLISSSPSTYRKAERSTPANVA
jgi:hypothetical protein